MYCDLAIIAPYMLLSLFKFILTKGHFVSADALKNININLINMQGSSYTLNYVCVAYFPIAILITTIYFACNKDSKKENSMSLSDNSNSISFEECEPSANKQSKKYVPADEDYIIPIVMVCTIFILGVALLMLR